jgi:hypothetical protein
MALGKRRRKNGNMKNILLLVLITVLCGCSDKKLAEDQGKQIAELKKEIRQIREDHLQFVQLVQGNTADSRSYNTNLLALMLQLRSASNFQTEKLAAHEVAIDRLTQNTTSAPRLSSLAPGRTQTTLKEGIPAAVYDQIIRDAQKEWPGDYKMQDFTARNQIESYKKLYGR